MISIGRLSTVLMHFLVLFFCTVEKITGEETAEYGVDVSTAIHHYIQDQNSQGYERYWNNINGCYQKYGKPPCDECERTRIAMNYRQPAEQHNYTEIGFKKIRVPIDAWRPLLEFYQNNEDKMHVESWPPGNTYVNHWENPSYMVSVEDRSLRGSFNLKQHIWATIQPIIEEWTGKKVEPTSMYGVRVYKEGAILATHVDRLPLVSSCIINVAQDLDEPWPLEVYSHEGKAYNVTMEPGDLVLYESHTVLHGRPYPLKGRFYSNLFVHYQPVDHQQVLEQDRRLNAEKVKKQSFFSRMLNGKKDTFGGHEQTNHHEDSIKRHLHIEHEEEFQERRRREKEEHMARMHQRRRLSEVDQSLKESDPELSADQEITYFSFFYNWMKSWFDWGLQFFFWVFELRSRAILICSSWAVLLYCFYPLMLACAPSIGMPTPWRSRRTTE